MHLKLTPSISSLLSAVQFSNFPGSVGLARNLLQIRAVQLPNMPCFICWIFSCLVCYHMHFRWAVEFQDRCQLSSLTDPPSMAGHNLQERLSELFELARADAVDGCHLVQRRRALAGDFGQGGVMQYDEGRHLAFLGKRQP